jgi:hypothetical protein
VCAAIISIALKLCTWLYISYLHIKFENGFYRPIFGRVTCIPLELSHFKGFYSFPDFFPQCVQLLHWNFVQGFISMTYKSSSKMVLSTNFKFTWVESSSELFWSPVVRLLSVRLSTFTFSTYWANLGRLGTNHLWGRVFKIVQMMGNALAQGEIIAKELKYTENF